VGVLDDSAKLGKSAFQNGPLALVCTQFGADITSKFARLTKNVAQMMQFHCGSTNMVTLRSAQILELLVAISLAE
jgi:hypothetical protein